MEYEYGLLFGPVMMSIEGPYASAAEASAYGMWAVRASAGLRFALIRRRPDGEWQDFAGHSAQAAWNLRWGRRG